LKCAQDARSSQINPPFSVYMNTRVGAVIRCDPDSARGVVLKRAHSAAVRAKHKRLCRMREELQLSRILDIEVGGFGKDTSGTS